MRAGDLKHKIIFHVKGASARDRYGNLVPATASDVTVWGNLRETTGKERVAGGSIENLRTATLRIRVSTGTRTVSEADTLSARGEVWKILGKAHADAEGDFYDILIEAGGAL